MKKSWVLFFLVFVLLLGTAIAGAGSDEGLDDSRKEETVCRHEIYRASEEKEIRYVDLSDSCHAKQLVQRMQCVNPACAHEAIVVLKEVLERHQWKNMGGGHYNDDWLHTYWDECQLCKRSAESEIFCFGSLCDDAQRLVFNDSESIPNDNAQAWDERDDEGESSF